MGRVLHVLLNKNGLDKYPSVYNALYCWFKRGWSNHIITGGLTEGFSELIEKEYRFTGGYLRKAAQLASVPGYFDIVIVYDPQDLEALYATRWLFPKNSYGQLIHHCLEIPARRLAGQSILKLVLHKMLFRAYKLIDTLIIQDRVRAELFFATFPQIKHIPCYYVTNSFIKAIEPVANSLDWFDKLRARSEFLVLYTGTMERWAFPDRLFESLLKIPEATFVFSGWSKDGYAEDLANRYNGATNIHFHLGAKRRPEFNYMVASSDVGLVCYQPIDQNVTQVGLSSGKLHKFLSFQKPVLTNGIASLHEFITRNGFGISVGVEGFREAIQNLASGYHEYCKNIRDRYAVLCNYEHEYMAFAQASVNTDKEFEQI